MTAPTLAEAAAYLGTVTTDPRLARALAEAVELLTDRLTATGYAAADTAAPARFWRMHCDVIKAIYERGRTAPGPDISPVRGTTAGRVTNPLTVVAADLEAFDAGLLPGNG